MLWKSSQGIIPFIQTVGEISGTHAYHALRDFTLFSLKKFCWASLVTQWLRIHLPTQGTQVRPLAREDPTCRGATKPTTTEPVL